MDMLADSGIAARALPADGGTGLGWGLAFLMDELVHGVVIVTVEGRLLHVNHAARHELGRGRALGTQNDVLRPCMSESASTLANALAKAAEGKRSLIELASAQGPGLTLAVLPLRSEAAGGPARAALLFARASVCESLMLCFFARSHGLTATEEHVLGVLCQGFSAPQIARQMNVAVSTVRSHVRSLCAKTRSSGVRQLINRVAMLPPVAPTSWHEPMH